MTLPSTLSSQLRPRHNGRQSAPLLLFRHRERDMFVLPLPRHRFRVGRSADCDLRLPDADQRLSREHFILEQRSGRLMIKDCSTNGTSCNGVPLSGGTRTLHSGDCIVAGSWKVFLDPPLNSGSGENHIAPCSDSTRRLNIPANGGHHNTSAVGTRHNMLGESPAMMDIYSHIDRLARFDVPVLINGDSGTGKELVANALHSSSQRAGKPLVAVNCAAIQESTASSTLFGHEKGSFTGASQRHAGVFEQSAGGTLFLDEIAELNAELQASLLRVLETRSIRPLGSTREIPVSFRLIAATHRDLRSEVAAGRFREDLFYRIGVTRVRLPALCRRSDDIPLLAQHFLCKHAPGAAPVLGPKATILLLRHSWPGNVRELRNVMMRALVLCDGPKIRPSHIVLDDPTKASDDTLTPPATSTENTPFRVPPPRPSSEQQKSQLIEALQRCRGNRTQAAALLGVSRSTLYSRIKHLEAVSPE